MALTELEIKNAKPEDKAYRMPDGDGLYLDVRPTGKSYWRMRYNFEGKENTLTFGEYPYVTLKEAREKRFEARKLITNGVDPAVRRDLRQMESEGPTFRDVSPEFMTKKHKESRSKKERSALEYRLRHYILPFLGNLNPDEITPPMILNVTRRSEGRGLIVTAHRVNQVICQVFRYDIATGQVTRDPSADL